MPDVSGPTTVRLRKIEWARMEGTRPRTAGSNARLGQHGLTVRPAIARVTADDGAVGFGYAPVSREGAEMLVGVDLDPRSPDAFSLEFPLWDLLGQRAGKPVWEVVAHFVRSDHKPAGIGAEEIKRLSCPSLAVRCYDTSLYFDDLHLEDDAAAVELVVENARQGLALGHRNFKVKIGRGARHMETDAGLRRDIAIVNAVRSAIGPGGALMVDGNNGFTLNLTKRFLDETAGANVYWIEEMFHEDAVLYRDLKEWLGSRGYSVKIADGEGDASPHLVSWARDGLIDILQYDVFHPGFSFWLALADRLVGSSVACAPHHYGMGIGNFVTGHLARAVPNFQYVEWDAAEMPWLDSSRYVVIDGLLPIPHYPGFGLKLDNDRFDAAVRESGFVVEA